MLNERHHILTDHDFWSRLEFAACRWLAASGDRRHAWLWIDGFLPESIRNTRLGVDVEGVAWLVSGNTQKAFQFIASIPQNMLGSHRRNIAIHELKLDEEGRHLEVTVGMPTVQPQESNSREGHPDELS
jgi:hypothetical protein